MARYFFVHRLQVGGMTQDQWIEDWKSLKARLPEEVHWLHSWIAPNADTLYCEWEAPDPKSVLTCFTEQEMALAPVREVIEVVPLEPEWLDEVVD